MGLEQSLPRSRHQPLTSVRLTLLLLTTIEILDLNGVSTEADVRETLKQNFTTNLGIKRVNLTRVTQRGQRAAFCEIDQASATKTLDKAHMKIGWFNCRIRPITRVTRCIKCHGFGRPSHVCKGPNRSKCCFKCGENNQKVAECTKQPKCFQCSPNADATDGLYHVADSEAHRVFCAALAEATRTQK